MDILAQLDQPLPKCWSIKPIPYLSSDEYGVRLREDVMRVLAYLQTHSRALRSWILVHILLVKAIVHEEERKLHALLDRKREIGHLLAQQGEKRPPGPAVQAPHHLSSTEHFHRSTSRAIDTQHPWDGSAYKSQLLQSIASKLSQKLVLQVFRHNHSLTKHLKQTEAHPQGRLHQLLRVCFTALVFEALSTKFIVWRAEQRVRNWHASKYLRTAFLFLRRIAKVYKKGAIARKLAVRMHDNRRQRAVLRLLLGAVMGKRKKLMLKQWGSRCYAVSILSEYFLQWCQVFLIKRTLRMDLLQRAGHKHSTNSKAKNNATLIAVNRTIKSLPNTRDKRFGDLHRLLSSFAVYSESHPSLLITRSASSAVPAVRSTSISWDASSDEHYAYLNRYVDNAVKISSSAGEREVKEQEDDASSSCVSFMEEDSLVMPSPIPAAQPKRKMTADHSTAARTPRQCISAPEALLFGGVPSSSSDSADSIRRMNRSSVNTTAISSVNAGGSVAKSKKTKSVLERALEISFLPDDMLPAVDAGKSKSKAPTPIPASQRKPYSMKQFNLLSVEEEEDQGRDDGLFAVHSGNMVKYNQLRRSIQLLKVQRLVTKAKSLFRRLRHSVRLRRHFHAIQRYYRYQMKHSLLQKMLAACQKLQHQHRLLDHIQIMRRQQRTFIQWKTRFQSTFLHKKHAIASLQGFHRMKWFWIQWKREYLKCQLVHRVLSKKSKYRRWKVFIEWKRWTESRKRIIQRGRQVSLRTLIGRCYRAWRHKFSSRLLLKRVFQTQEQAWHHRRHLYSQSDSPSVSTFSFLFNILHAWHAYASTAHAERLATQQQHKAYYYRGMSLLHRSMAAWKIFHTQQSKVQVCQNKHSAQLRAQCFLTWKAHTQQSTEHEEAYASRNIQRIQLSLRLVFQEWKLFKLLQTYNRLYCRKNNQLLKSRVFRKWRALFVCHHTLAKGLAKLADVWDQAKLRMAFVNWPGRLQSIAATIMAEMNLSKYSGNREKLQCNNPILHFRDHYNKRAFDDHKSGKENFIDDEHALVTYNHNLYTWPLITGHPLFHQLLVLCMKRKMVDNMSDSFHIRLIYYLLRNTFIVWKAYRLHCLEIRKTLLVLKNRQRRLCVEYILKHWISLVPAVSYRVMTWIRTHKTHNRFYKLFNHQNPEENKEKKKPQPAVALRGGLVNKDEAKAAAAAQSVDRRNKALDKFQIHTAFLVREVQRRPSVSSKKSK